MLWPSWIVCEDKVTGKELEWGFSDPGQVEEGRVWKICQSSLYSEGKSAGDQKQPEGVLCILE